MEGVEGRGCGKGGQRGGEVREEAEGGVRAGWRTGEGGVAGL